MKVFLSWSGARSKALAEFMERWLGHVIHTIEPVVSWDFQKGARWAAELSDKLEECTVAIIFLTPENQRAPWLLFEAGAISKVKDALVCTLLLDLEAPAIKPPLDQFQSTTLEKEDVRKLIHSLNRAARASGDQVPRDDRLNEIFENNWPRLETRAAALCAEKPAPVGGEPLRASPPLSLLVTAPRDLPGFDVTRIVWDHAQCWLVSDRLRENIRLVPSRVGPTFRVHRAAEILSQLEPDDYVELKLVDAKGNRWEVRTFYPFENVLWLSAVEPPDKLLRDYGEGNE